MPHHDIRLSNPFARNCVKALAKIATGSLIASCLSLGAAGYAHAKIQRSFINLSFEEPPRPSDNCWSIRVSDAVPGGTWQRRIKSRPLGGAKPGHLMLGASSAGRA